MKSEYILLEFTFTEFTSITGATFANEFIVKVYAFFGSDWVTWIRQAFIDFS